VSYGAYLISATAMGIYKSLDDAARTVELPDVYRPQKQNHTVYAAYFNIFERLSTQLSDAFEAIVNLQQLKA